MSRLGHFRVGTGAAIPELAAAASALGHGPEVDYGRVVKHPDLTHALAQEYDRLPSFDPGAVPAFKAMHREVVAQFEHLKRLGYTFEVTDHDPYDNPVDMMSDLRENRHLKVLSSATTGGHPVFGEEGNNMFRMVHDALGHAATGRGFDRHGEEAAYLAHARTFSPLARRALATETRGQNSVVNVTGQFPENKVALLPERFSGVTPIAGRRSMLREAARQSRQFHETQGLPT